MPVRPGTIPLATLAFLQAALVVGHCTALYLAVDQPFLASSPLPLIALLNAVLVLPAILLLSPAAFAADRLPGALLLRHATLFNLAVALLVVACFHLGWFQLAVSLTALFAVQNAFFAPAMIVNIREIATSDRLAATNAVVQAAAITGLLLGGMLASAVTADRLAVAASAADAVRALVPVGWLLVAVAAAMWLTSFRLGGSPEEAPTAPFERVDYLRLHYLRRNLALLGKQRSTRSAVVGLVTFWSIAQAVFILLPTLSAGLSSDGTAVPGLLLVAGVAVVLGAVLAGRISQRHLETGAIPFCALGIALTLAVLPSLASNLALGAALAIIGLLGGLLVVPLNAILQFYAPNGRLGTVAAARSWCQALGMLLGLGIACLVVHLGLNPQYLLYALALIAAAGTVYTVEEHPHALTRAIAMAILKRRYRIQVLGFENLPRDGGVLMLGNHTSVVDWALLQVACPRQVRFVLENTDAENWFMKLFFRLTGTANISNKGEKTLAKIRKLLNRGEVVCLFPERSMSGNGQFGDFSSYYEGATSDVENSIILPFYLRGLWGSKFSRADEGLRDSRAPTLRRDLIVAFGKPLPMDTRAGYLKQKVFDLSITAWETYTKTLDPLPLAWLKTVKQDPGDVCTVDASGVKLSRKRFAAATLAFAEYMRLDPATQNVGLLLPASNAAAIATMTVMLKGRTAVHLNFTASPAAVRAGIQEAGITQVFTSSQFETRLEARGIRFDELLGDVQVVYMEDIRAQVPQWKLVLKLLQVSLLPADVIYRLHGQPTTLEDPAAILFSSGSEGKPKGVVLSHRNIQSNCKQISDVLNTRVDDVVMASLPPFHAFGLTVTLIMPLIEGIPIACHPDPTDVLGIAQTVARYRATILFGTATFLSLYARNPKVKPIMLESLRFVVAGAEKLPEKVRKDFERKFNKTIFEGYGATETTPVASVNVPDALDTENWTIQPGNREGSVGMPLPGTSFKVVDPESFEELPLGEDGMILISGNQVMLGYLNDEQKTREAIFEKDGMRWYATGDKGHITPEGFLVIVDRFSRFAKIGGEMVSLGAVEQEALAVLPDDPEADLAAAAVPDPRKGERVVLLVTSETWADCVREKMVDADTRPLLVPGEVIQVDEIPKLGSGKTDFSALNSLAREECDG